MGAARGVGATERGASWAKGEGDRGRGDPAIGKVAAAVGRGAGATGKAGLPRGRGAPDK